MDDAPSQLFQHRPRPLDILRLAANHGEQRAGLHLWDRAEHRRLDQPRAARFDQRHKLAAGHRLQRAHLDEQLALDVAFEETGRAGENLSHAVVFGDAGNDDLGGRGNAAGIGGDTQSVRGQRLVRFGALVPARHVKSLLAQAAGYCRAHAAEADNAKFHKSSLCVAHLTHNNRRQAIANKDRAGAGGQRRSAWLRMCLIKRSVCGEESLRR